MHLLCQDQLLERWVLLQQEELVLSMKNVVQGEESWESCADVFRTRGRQGCHRRQQCETLHDAPRLAPKRQPLELELGLGLERLLRTW